MPRPSHPGRPTWYGPLGLLALAGAGGSAELLLVDRADFRRPRPREEWPVDPVTLQATETYDDLHPCLPCLIEPDDPRDRTVIIGDAPVYIGAYFVAVPLHIVDLRDGDVLDVTASHDPSLIGRRLILRDVAHATTFLLRHMQAIET